ncbi:hypothetical protein CMQ_4680 [Grosmannia clavigera kw1407]|uniref:Protein prenyltransferase n=1 Tax=Grosmannia clavigera (strain kw1407 / UAMH 11150) TaxID=655863 RepID=F0XTN3_GROCL|nr:uncharacterized protein CMQ_4680 [Grosmannia clavigera kw1407]EFW98828.1 hypothetical protein CMQ_4680 [Grosmannia clavigera kw1407]
MSRALDKETVAALQLGDPTAAYRAIAGVLTQPSSSPSDELLDIEFLGRGHTLSDVPSDGDSNSNFFLRDGNSVAILKLALVQAFFVARRILQQYQGTTAANADNASTSPSSLDDIMAATAVILLFDPEHLTAANTRKRIILSSHAATTRGFLLAAECRLVDSLLTSHLHRHTKSPTLWSHRRWLVALHDHQAQACHRDVVDVIMVAAVRHPRNYYAWDHARWLVTTLRGDDVDAAVAALLPPVHDWCFRHHDDTSGWSFLLFLLSKTVVVTVLDETLSQVLHMTASLHWTGESVWVFLRTAAAAAAAAAANRQEKTGISDPTDSCDRLRQTAHALQTSTGLDPRSQDWRVLQQAQDWSLDQAATGPQGPGLPDHATAPPEHQTLARFGDKMGQPSRAWLSHRDGKSVVPTLVTVGAVTGVATYVRRQLMRESQAFDRYFSTYNTPESEASRKRVFEGASEDPRTSLMNILGWKKE